MAAYFEIDDVEAIYVIINDKDEMSCADKVHSMLPLYGALRDRVRIIVPSEILEWNFAQAIRPSFLLKRLIVHHRKFFFLRVNKGWRGNHGWLMQQAFKLCIARVVTSEFTLILDCKNFLVGPTTSFDFVSPCGRPKSNLRTPSPAQRTWIKRAFEIFAISAPGPEEQTAPSTTPFCIRTEILQDCLNEAERRLGPIEGYFGYRPFWARGGKKASEFMIMYAYVTYRFGGWLSIFDLGLPPAAAINRKMDDGTIEYMIDLVEQKKINVFSVHRSRVRDLNPVHLQRLRKILKDRNLEISDILF